MDLGLASVWGEKCRGILAVLVYAGQGRTVQLAE